MKRIVVVGGVAGGATAAARATRLSDKVNVQVFERSPDVSFANCGLPYYIGGEIKDRSLLALQTPASLQDALGKNSKVFASTEVLSIDRAAHTVQVRDLAANAERTVPYDKLVLSPGASPFNPPMFAKLNDKRIMTLRNLQDMDRMYDVIRTDACKRVAVIGAGFIGLEMVEQLHHIGKHVILVEKAPNVLPPADSEMARLLEIEMQQKGIEVYTNKGVSGITANGAGKPLGITLDSGSGFEVDAVVLCIGVRPESTLASKCGITTNARGFIPVNEFMQTNDKDVYAVGDAVETADIVFPEKRTTVLLGNVANMQARVAADHLVLGKSIPYKGSVGTAIVRVFDQVLAVTGWSERRLKEEKIPYAVSLISSTNHASYYPGALPVTLKITYDPASGRIFGAQGVGIDGVDKRIDALATAITGKLTVDEVSQLQLCYSPPFGSARDPVNLVAMTARNAREGLVVPAFQPPEPKSGKILVDVRPGDAFKTHNFEGSISIPLGTLDAKAPTLEKGKTYVTTCKVGKSAYFAARKLTLAGHSSEALLGGINFYKPPEIPSVGSCSSSTSSCSAQQQPTGIPTPSQPTSTLDCCGMSCPGPLMKLKAATEALAVGSSLIVKASDPGFAADVKAFCSSSGLQLASLAVERGIITAVVSKGAQPAQPVGSNPTGSAAGVRKGATIVVFSQDMDKVLAAFVIANGAAAMGGDVTMFFTFWGLNGLRDANRRATAPKKVMDFMFEKMMPRGISHLPISNMNFGGIGPRLLRYQMGAKNLPNLVGLMKSAQEQKIRIVACTMSMDAMGITKEELIDGVEYGGVAEYLAAAEKSGTNLFI